MEQLIESLEKFVVNPEELINCMNSIDFTMATKLKICFDHCFQNIPTDNCRKFEIDSIVDYLHDELNTGHWSNVPVTIRYAFTSSTYIKCLIHIKQSNNYNLTNLRKALQIVDLGLLLGAPLLENRELLTNCARYLNQEIQKLNAEEFSQIVVTNKRKSHCDFIEQFNKIDGIEIPCESCPSLETFSKLYFNRQKPVKLKDCMSHWPALNKWIDVNYLIKVVGNRTIPIEIGSHYVDDDWHQKLMLFSDFIKEYFWGDANDIGYLAQHNLFNQVPELRNDIYVPDYCCLTKSDDLCELDINAWLGPEGTVSPLHQDPKNNFLAQVFGTKQIILISPEDTRYLYTYDDKLLSNTSRVDPIRPDLEKYPAFKNATIFKCLLQPGEMLYIPVKWWHHVTALEKSFSVSFWWE